MAARMTTRVVKADAAGIALAAQVLVDGGIAAIPTETVYGLAARVSGPGVNQIFAAKGRPQDNPLIAHVASPDMVRQVAAELPPQALRLMEAFWPGPLSLILRRRESVPDAVTAGQETVAVRMPDHAAALAIIRAVGEPLAAPSANTSGRPSPTRAEHVLADLGGRIPLIVDSGFCPVGVESTVLDLSGDLPVRLRPGDITPERLCEVLPQVQLHEGLLAGDDRPASPGMKYRHYAPTARVIVRSGDPGEVARELRERYDYDRKVRRKPRILCTAEHASLYAGLDCCPLGRGAAGAERRLFDELRRAEMDGRDIIYFHYDKQMGLAVKNRICKAAGGQSDIEV